MNKIVFNFFHCFEKEKCIGKHKINAEVKVDEVRMGKCTKCLNGLSPKNDGLKPLNSVYMKLIAIFYDILKSNICCIKIPTVYENQGTNNHK